MVKKIFSFIILSCIYLYSQDAGNTGLSFLKIGSSSRNIAVSDIGLLNSDPSSVFYNPAVVNLQNSSSIMFTHQAWIQDLSSEIIYGNFEMLGLPFTLGVNTTKITGFEARTNPTDTPDSKFDINYFYTSLSTGFGLIENLSFGFTIKYLYESILSNDASGTGYDLGLLYENIIDNLSAGLSVRNLGSMKELREEQTKLPADIIFNTSYNVELGNSSFDLLPVAGIQKYLEQDDIHIHAGTEVTYDKQFSIRLGYITGYETKGLTAGAGIYWNGFNVDYAFTPFSMGIGNANTISLMYTF